MILRFAILIGVVFMFGSCEQNTGPSKDPDENLFYSRYRNIYQSYGKVSMDSTKILLQHYLKEFPQNAQAWAFLGAVAYYVEDFEDARSAYQQAIAINRNQAAHFSGLGNTYSAMEMNDSAEFYFKKALALQDSTYENYFNLSLLYSKTGDTARSLLYADSSLLKERVPVSGLAGLSLVYAKAGVHSASVELFEQAKRKGIKDTLGFKEVLEGKTKLDHYYRKNHY